VARIRVPSVYKCNIIGRDTDDESNKEEEHDEQEADFGRGARLFEKSSPAHRMLRYGKWKIYGFNNREEQRHPWAPH
jgi:hypothetical protein